MSYRKKRNIPQFNSSSTADIAFLLLIFFLITSSLDSRTGIYRKLSPASSEEVLRKKTDIRERNLISFSIDENNALWIEDDSVTLPEIKELAKVFISNPSDLEFLPDKEIINLPYFGNIPVTSNHIINLEISRDADYQTYISVLNELTAAYNELRNELAYNHFHKDFSRLTEEEKMAIRDVYPLRISEKELPGKEDGDE